MPELTLPNPDVQMPPTEAQATGMPDSMAGLEIPGAVLESDVPVAPAEGLWDSQVEVAGRLGETALGGTEDLPATPQTPEAEAVHEPLSVELPIQEELAAEDLPEEEAAIPDAETGEDEENPDEDTTEPPEEKQKEPPPVVPQTTEPVSLDAFDQDNGLGVPILPAEEAKHDGEPQTLRQDDDNEQPKSFVDTLNDTDQALWNHIVDLNNGQPDGEVAEQLQALEHNFTPDRAGVVVGLAQRSAERRQDRGDTTGAEQQLSLAHDVSELSKHIFGATPRAA